MRTNILVSTHRIRYNRNLEMSTVVDLIPSEYLAYILSIALNLVTTGCYL